MSPAENKRAKKRKNKKGRTVPNLSSLSSFQASSEAATSTVMDKKVSGIQDNSISSLDAKSSPMSSEKRICIKCHRPQTSSDIKKPTFSFEAYSAGLLEGFRVSRDLRLCDEKNIELGIPDPLWLCEECENFLLLSDNKAMYNTFGREEIDDTDLMSRTYELGNENTPDIVSLMGGPSVNQSNGGTCLCAACCERKQVEDEEEEECRELKRGWLDIKSFLHKIYQEEGLYLSDPHSNFSGAPVGESSLIDYLTQSLSKKKKSAQCPTVEVLKEWVHRLCKQDPQHLFLCLESQVKLFISEMRIRLLSLLKHLPSTCKSYSSESEGECIENDSSDSCGNSNLIMAIKACLQSKSPTNYDGDLFLLWVFHEYTTLCTASRRVAPILEELEATHLKNFNLTWELVNRHLFRSIVYSDPVLMLHIQRCCLNCSCTLHLNIEQRFSQKSTTQNWSNQTRNSSCGQHNQSCSPANGNAGSHGGVECPTLTRFAKLDDEMTVINVVYREALVLIEEFNKRQMVQAKQRFKDWESFHVQWKMVEQEVLNKKNAFAKAFYQKSLTQCQNTQTPAIQEALPASNHCNVTDSKLSSSPPNNLNLPNSGGLNKTCSNLGILNLNEEALVKLAMPPNQADNASGSSSNCSSSPSSSCSSSSSESSSASSLLTPGSVVEIKQGEDLKLLLQEITKLNSNEILPKQVTDLLINSAGLASPSSSSSIPVPGSPTDFLAAFSGNLKCETGSSPGCLHKHRGDISPSLFSSQPKNSRSDVNSYRRNEYLNLYNPVKIKTSLTPPATLSVEQNAVESNSSCECHDCLTLKNPALNLQPMTDISSSATVPPPIPSPSVGFSPLLPHHLSDIARSAASHLASKALIHPHLYNLHARKTSKNNSSSLLETQKKLSSTEVFPTIPNVSQQASSSNSIDFELVAKEVFREQVKLAAQGEWSLDIVKNKVAEAVMGNLGINNAQSGNNNSNTSVGTVSSSNVVAACPQSKPYFAPIQRNGKASTSPRSGSLGEISTTTLPTTSHNVGTQSDALPLTGVPLKVTQGTNCAIGLPTGANIPNEKSHNFGNCTAENSRIAEGPSTKSNSSTTESVAKGTSTSTNTVTQKDQIVMTEGSDCQMSGRHHHHHHHHSKDQCCDSNSGNFTEGDESGLDDSCSERSSSTSTSNPRESRVCDCCYCEVFGHGVPVVAPVSRNYPEMRERLRLRLSKRKAESSAGTSKTNQQLSISTSVSSVNLPETLPVTDKNSGKIGTGSADDRELDALLRYINGTELDNDSESLHPHEHQPGCSGNCQKSVNGTRLSTNKTATKKQRKKARKATSDEKSLDKKVSISPPAQDGSHSNRDNPKESSHRETKKARSNSPLEQVNGGDINNISPSLSHPKIEAKISNNKSHDIHNYQKGVAESSSLKSAPLKQTISNGEVSSSGNTKSKNKSSSQSRSKSALVLNQPTNDGVLKEEIANVTLVKEQVVKKEPIAIVGGSKKNPTKVNGIVPISVINSTIQNDSTSLQTSLAHIPPIRTKKSKKKKNCVEDSSSLDEVFLPKDIDLENGELDEAEKELEAFKRFCMASVPLANKEKVHVNLKDIVIKKKVNNPNMAAVP